MRLTRKQRPPSTPRPSKSGPLMAIGCAPFGRRQRDDADGAQGGAYVLRPGPDGKLYGIRKRD